MNILKNDPFTKTVFTDVLPSNRLPREIRKRPRGIYLTRVLPNKSGSHILGGCVSYRRWHRGILGFFTVRTLLNFWTNIVVHLRGTEEFCKPHRQKCVDNIHCYIASVNTKRDWLICSHVALDKCNVSRPGNK